MFHAIINGITRHPKCTANCYSNSSLRRSLRQDGTLGHGNVRGRVRSAISSSSDPKVVTPDLKEVIESLIARENLSESQTMSAMSALLSGAEPTQISAFLVLLRAKGETPEEVTHFSMHFLSVAHSH